MPYDFPNSPTSGQTVTMPDGSTRVWDGTKWKAGPGTGTGGIPDAPSDATYYGRENGTWQRVLALSGGTLTGVLTLNADPASGLQPATKQYTDTRAVPAGGAVNQVLTKTTAADYAVGWMTPA